VVVDVVVVDEDVVVEDVVDVVVVVVVPWSTRTVLLQDAPHTLAEFLFGSLASVQLVLPIPFAFGSR